MPRWSGVGSSSRVQMRAPTTPSSAPSSASTATTGCMKKPLISLFPVGPSPATGWRERSKLISVVSWAATMRRPLHASTVRATCGMSSASESTSSDDSSRCAPTSPDRVSPISRSTSEPEATIRPNIQAARLSRRASPSTAFERAIAASANHSHWRPLNHALRNCAIELCEPRRVSTGVLSPRLAVVMAVIFNILGAMGGTAVAATVGRGIVEPSAMTLPAITASMLSIIAWGTLAARLGIPVSKSHALLAGLAGAGLAGGGWAALQWTGWQKVGIGLVCSLGLGFCGAFLIGRLVITMFGRARPTPARRTFDRLQLLSAAFMAFNHGLNDGQKFMGVFALTMLAGGATSVFEIPWWVVLVCALTM